ncbi:hypothetical protein J4229_02520 [Candidatus Pacearchaeota archaeon]|nr:hypothetical protein [Candidatus Pacearchaeota archaeon]
MDCCDTKDKNQEESAKDVNSMVEIKKSTLLWIVIGILLITTIFLTIKASSIGTTGAATTIDTTGWTADELMNYEMHGIVPARASASSSSSASGVSSQMVGGC